jgi:hypothetical protein
MEPAPPTLNYETKVSINSAAGTVEDVAGSLSTTQTLVGTLIGRIEGAQEIARRQRETPASISAEALDYRLDELWALAAAIDERLRNDNAVLNAITDQGAMADH